MPDCLTPFGQLVELAINHDASRRPDARVCVCVCVCCVCARALSL